MFAGVVCGKQVLSLDCQESIPRIHTWEIVVWQDGLLFTKQKSKEFPSGVSNVPSPSVLPWKPSNPVFSRAKTKPGATGSVPY